MRQRIRSILGSRRSNRPPTNPVKNPTCSEFEVDTWAISRFVLDKLVPIVSVQPFPLNEQMLMVAAVCRLAPAYIFEWGTHVGTSARIFYECTSHFGIQAEVHSIDLPDDVDHVEHPHEGRGKLVRGLPGVHLHQGDGLDIALQIWRSVPHKPRPLFLLDGDHSYQSVYRELRGITTEIPDANVLLHDTFYQSLESAYNVGPYRAIEDLLRSNGARYRRIDSGLGLPGMTLLYQL